MEAPWQTRSIELSAPAVIHPGSTCGPEYGLGRSIGPLVGAAADSDSDRRRAHRQSRARRGAGGPPALRRGTVTGTEVPRIQLAAASEVRTYFKFG